jgi:hypothetical protein
VKRAKDLVVLVPQAVRAEIENAARRTSRSVAFIVRRALSAAKGDGAVEPGAKEPLALSVDEDDPPDLAARLRALTAGRSLDEAVAASWAQTRTRFAAWIAREEAAEEGTRADELDLGLKLAAAPTTPPARLAELSLSEYPRVRALCASNPATPLESLAALARDRERVVKAAAEANPRTPKAGG